MPQAHTTKGELLDYHVRIADVMLFQLRERLLHMHRRDDLHRPTAITFDPDPGAGVDGLGCAARGAAAAGALGGVGLKTAVKTSGSKGLQVHVPLNTKAGYEHTKPLSRRVAQLLGADRPSSAVSRMQGAAAGRGAGRPEPEHRAQVDGLRLLRAGEGPAGRVDAAALAGERVEAHGDLFAGVLTVEPSLG